MDDKLYNVGKIVNTHGIKGEVKVIRITDFEERFQKGQQLFFVGKGSNEVIALTVAAHRKHKNFDLLQFESYNSINEVEPFKEGMLKVHHDQMEPLDEGNYYYHEIIGCKVVTQDGDELGVIKEILAPGANDVWVVKRDNQKDLLVPYIEDIVKSVNVKEKMIVIEPMEGLLE
ncbi:ribosome maturation factor RimM [Aquibacillus koreensis]|uniref:Ribosome maturation factor RimM n=1 Tax=Aquibacillus koreensis TaxID=279446 RepID=A0A9X3WQQ9_9BACI|nr:ribosome maturation factor RimM [Aquibacillus koreensis]MCT2534500.1 ribosome maturation factor RimM [Aquibacillus koreensis]MDC3421906.1 ribosome maturation factor RimM [Aquibacillus koreensis]